jgi:succinate dehydrogenase / fumarate reductase cytochrome b subunit
MSMGIGGQGAQSTTRARERPLSPHLQIWRWHVTMLTSILHRVSGVALYGSALALAGWVVTLASGPKGFAAYRAALGSPLGKVALFGVTLAIFYHLANGLRHLIWDGGYGLGVKTADSSSLAVLIFTIVATGATWIYAASAGFL